MRTTVKSRTNFSRLNCWILKLWGWNYSGYQTSGSQLEIWGWNWNSHQTSRNIFVIKPSLQCRFRDNWAWVVFIASLMSTEKQFLYKFCIPSFNVFSEIRRTLNSFFCFLKYYLLFLFARVLVSGGVPNVIWFSKLRLALKSFWGETN